MKTLKALRMKEAELKAEGRQILDAADRASAGVLSAEQEARFQAIEAELTDLAGSISSAEQASERRRAMEGSAVPVSGSGAITVGADRATLDPRAGFASLADFATAVRRANPHGSNPAVDQRLAAMYQASPTGYMREGGSTDGYMVPPEYRDRIWELVMAGDNLLAEVDTEPTSANQVSDFVDETTPWGGGGVQAYWRAEASQMQATRDRAPNPRNIILHELYAFVTASEELLEDAPRLANRLETKSAQAIGWKVDDAIIYGNGVGKPLGYMNSAALVSVAKETGQAADSVVAKNLAKMYSRMLPDGMSRTHWRMNSDVIPELVTMTLGDQPIWTPPRDGIVNAPGGFLLGRPIRLTEHCKTLGDKGDIQFIDPKGYHALRKSSGIKFASSMHLYFDYGLQAFRWTFRVGGQPHISQPVSPKNGAATKSYFVTLDDRA